MMTTGPGPAEHAEDRLALERNRHALAGIGLDERHAVAVALDRLHVRGAHLIGVLHEHELGEVVIDAGAHQMLAGAELPALAQRVAAELLVQRGARRPGATPVLPAVQAARDVLEVREQHAVGNEPRQPVRDG